MTEKNSKADQDIQNDAERFDFEDNEGFLNALNNRQGSADVFIQCSAS